MGKTTVNLTEKTEPLKQQLMPIYGLRNILSAGVLLFSKLDADNQRKAIEIANGAEIDLDIDVKTDKVELDELWNIVEKLARKQGVKVKKPK